MVREIPLTRGYVARVDPEDYALYGCRKWYAIVARPEYAVAAAKIDGQVVYLHRLIASAPPHLCVDHINGDPLDNRRANLRLCTKAQNNANRRKPKGNAPYKGVAKIGHKWRARLGTKHLGLFESPEEAAAAYDSAALAVHGEFARPSLGRAGQRLRQWADERREEL